jgi:SAM-dependent methyltransferase
MARGKTNVIKRKTGAQHFWNKEYTGKHQRTTSTGSHLAISSAPSDDLVTFMRYVERSHKTTKPNITSSILDLGCGNGRNLIFLCKEYSCRGIGYDISLEAIRQAKGRTHELNIKYESRSIGGSITLPFSSQEYVLDMMTSHFLPKDRRERLTSEIYRVLKPGGWLFLKTFLDEGDQHAKRLLKTNAGDEEGTYIHPVMGVAEHVYTLEEIEKQFGQYFTIHKIVKSHGHIDDKGRARKRRSVSVYMQKTH